MTKRVINQVRDYLTVIPEPSCAHCNALLDRVFIKGDFEAGIPSILECMNAIG